jgi:hypothetical protein
MPVSLIYANILGLKPRTFTEHLDESNHISCFKMSMDDYIDRAKRGNARISSLGGFNFKKLFSDGKS